MNKINCSIISDISEVKNQFEQLQKKYHTYLPKVDPSLINDLLLRHEKNPDVIPTYIVEVFTKQGIDVDEAKEYVYQKTGMIPAIYDKGTHYVTNQKLTLEILKEISDCEDVLEVNGHYIDSGTSISISYEPKSFRNYACYH
ncbi:MAG: hypothetical protein JO297_09510 [Nitrososphaeraceae archaeon]|nr:hypothetical protein [Nitrososphaeraceae archaeon]